MTENRELNTGIIKSLAGDFGFSGCGISRAEKLTGEADRLQKWVENGFHGGMKYIPDRFDLRIDPRQLLPEARSVISLLYNYFPHRQRPPRANFLISKYAYGRDYHHVLRGILKDMATQIRQKLGDIKYRICVDSAPIMEKAWAARCGLGWIGKNTCLIDPCQGSFFFLSEILIDRELIYDEPITDKCGECRKCVDACPTGALVEPYRLDAGRCISYLTIEHKAALPEEMAGSYRGWIFGCDICQDVCPFNSSSRPHNEPRFEPDPRIFTMAGEDWRNLTKAEFEDLFARSAVKRTGFEGLKRNIQFVD